MATFTKVNPGDPIQAHQLNQVIDALIGTASAGVPIAVTAVNDATNYALTVQNDEAGNSRALNVLKSDGTNLIRADASGVTLGSPLNLPTGSITSTYIQDGGVQNVDLGPDVARPNLVTNGGFEIWQRGNGPFTADSAFTADAWQIALSGGTMSVSRDGVNVQPGSAFSAVVTVTGTNTQLLGKYEPVMLAGRTLSASAAVKTSTANAVRLSLYDGTAIQYSAYHSGDGNWHTLTVTATLGATFSDKNVLRFAFAAACTANLDNVMLVVGSQPANFVPMHPADDLARCLRYYEVVGGSGSNDLIASGYAAGGGSAWYWPINYKVEKPVAPTLTKNGTWGVTNCGQPTIPTGTYRMFTLQAISTAAGAIGVQNNGAGSTVTVEANPLIIPVGLLMMHGAQPDYVICGLALVAAWMVSMNPERTTYLTGQLRQFPGLDRLIDSLRSPAAAIRAVALRMFRPVLP